MSDYLKITKNKNKISEEIENGDFKENLSDHIVFLKSFIDKEQCKKVVEGLKGLGEFRSAPYTDGLLDDAADSFFDPEINLVKDIQEYIFTHGLKLYSERVRSFNWSYFGREKFRYSEMMLRKYHEGSKFEFHYDDFLEELFPQWFARRKNVLSCTVYLNDDYEGGDIEFTSGKSYAPSVGDVIMFPSNWMFYHKVNQVTKGIKYSGTFWFYYGSARKIFKQNNHKIFEE